MRRPTRDLWSTPFSHTRAVPDADPAPQVARAHGDDVEKPVVDLRLGQDEHAARECTAIADEDGVGARRPRGGAVEGVPQAHCVDVLEDARDGLHVGEPADPLLEVGVRRRDHLRVEADADHDDECVRFRLAALPGDLRDPRVDRVILARERRADGLLHAVDAHAEVAREQIAGARGHEHHGHAGIDEPFRDRSHGAVSAGDEHGGHASVDGVARDTLAGVVDARLEPEGFGPAVVLLRGRDRAPQLLQLDLDRVDDDAESRKVGGGASSGHGVRVEHVARAMPRESGAERVTD